MTALGVSDTTAFFLWCTLAMNATSRQTTAVMAITAAVDKLFSGAGIESKKTD